MRNYYMQAEFKWLSAYTVTKRQKMQGDATVDETLVITPHSMHSRSTNRQGSHRNQSSQMHSIVRSATYIERSVREALRLRTLRLPRPASSLHLFSMLANITRECILGNHCLWAASDYVLHRPDFMFRALVSVARYRALFHHYMYAECTKALL